MNAFFRNLTLTLCLGLASSVSAQNFTAVENNANAKLQAALQELADVRKQIADEKIPLSTQLTALESKLVSLNREFDQLQKTQASSADSVTRLDAQLTELEKVESYANDVMKEFINSFNDRLHTSEKPLYEAMLRKASTAPTNPNLSDQEKITAQLDVIKVAAERVEKLIGGAIYPGEAVTNGDILQGKFATFGPIVYFAAEDGSAAGIAENQETAENAAIVNIGDNYAKAIAETINTGSGEIPFDATLGKAIKIAKAKKSIGDYVEDGGEVGYAIIALGLVSILIAIFKVYEVTTFRAPSTKDIDTILDHIKEGQDEEARNYAENVGGISGEMLTEGVEHAKEKRGLIEELMFEKILFIRPKLERFLPFLAITAAVAPLMGLLGTVIGMIKTFRLITLFGAGDAKSLSSGISEALVTTALGLIVAIPILILHGILTRMAKRKIGIMEQATIAFVNGVSIQKKTVVVESE